MRSVLVMAIGLIGCTGAADVSSTDNALFTITKVQLDGEETKILDVQTVARESAGVAPAGVSLSEEAIQRDNPCTGTSLSLYDGSVSGCAHNGCNQICFSGTGTVSLGSYCRIYNPLRGCQASWSAAVRSHNGNGHDAELCSPRPPAGCPLDDPQGEYVGSGDTNANSWGQSAAGLTIYD